MVETIVLLLLLPLLIIGGIILIAHLASQASRVRRLEEQLAGLRNLVASLQRDLEGPAQMAPPSAKAPVATAAQTPAPPAPAKPLAESQPPERPAVPSPPRQKPSRSREEWEALIGGKLLNRIGALAVILAVGFFLKYAFDNNWITEATRVLIGAGVGLACLLVAERAVRRAYAVFAQGLVGAGIAVLYVTVYASFNFYALLSQGVAFVLMSAVTVLSFQQAFRHNALAVSLLGLLGGFLTPLLLRAEETNVPGLFAYLAVLDVGLLAVVFRRERWAVLEPLAFLGTWAIYFSWYSVDYSEVHLWTCVAFLGAIWVLFHAADLLRVLRGGAGLADLRRFLAIFYALVLYASLLAVLEHESDLTRTLATLAVAVLYAASARLIWNVGPALRPAVSHYLVSAAILLFASTIIYTEDFLLITICALEALLVIWLGLRLREKFLWVAGMLFLPVLILLLFATGGAFQFTPLSEYRFLLNQRVLAYVVLGASFASAGVLYRRQFSSRAVSEALQYGWLLLLYVLISVEITDLFSAWSLGRPELVAEHLSFQASMVLGAVWAMMALPLAGFGLGAQMRPVFYAALWMLLVGSGLAMLRALFYVPIEEYRFLLNMRTAGLFVVAGASYGVSALLTGPEGKFSYAEKFRSLFRFVTVLSMLVLCSTETWDVYRYASSTLPAAGDASELARLANLQQLSLSSIWLLFSIGLMMLGFWRRDRAFRLQAMALFGVAILKIFLYDLSFLETLYRIFSFIGLGVILLFVSYLYQRFKEIILSPSLSAEENPGA